VKPADVVEQTRDDTDRKPHITKQIKDLGRSVAGAGH